MSEQGLTIIYRNFGIADAFPDGTVELNKHLENYPNLKKALIQHELRHTSEQRFNKKDLIHDLTTMNQIHQWEMVKFMVRHPLSLVQVLPAYYSKERGLVYDKNSIFIWSILLSIIGIGLWIGL